MQYAILFAYTLNPVQNGKNQLDEKWMHVLMVTNLLPLARYHRIGPTPFDDNTTAAMLPKCLFKEFTS